MRNKKKIIRSVTVSNSIGFFEDVIEKQRIDGYETVIVTSPGFFLDEFRIKHPDFKTIEVPMERHISLWKDVLALFRMIRVFLKERPYVVHSMTPKAGLLCMIAAWLTRVPVRIHTFTGLVWPSLSGRRRRLLITTDKILCACATNIIPEGKGVLDDLKNNNVCKKPMRVLGYGNVRGVDMKRFDPTRLHVSKDNKVFNFLFIGRLARDKGIDELIEAYTKLHDKFELTTLTLIGGNEKALDPISKLTESRIEANPSIVYCGTKFDEELIEYYTKADCFVMPSYREGFPNTVLEAGAMGLPQIVTDINGSREIVVDEIEKQGSLSIRKNGIVIPSKDAESLYIAMERMLVDNEMRSKMTGWARQMIGSRFERGFVISCQIDFYKELLK